MKRSWKTLIHASVWIIGWLFLNLSKDLTFGHFKSTDWQMLLPSTYGTLLNMVVVYGNAHWLLPRFWRVLWKYFLLLLFFLFVLSLAESLLDYWVILSRDSEWIPPFWGVIFMDNMLFHVLFFLLPSYSLWFWERIRKAERDRERLREEKLRAELGQLRHQVNPHFLFNILNNLYSSSLQASDERTAEGIAQLADMMRYMLYESGGDQVALNGEVDYIRAYIALQKLRFESGDRVEITFDVDAPEAERTLIPPMLLIPFVENAFKHGISLENASFIHLFLQVDAAGSFHFRCENSNFGETRKSLSKGYQVPGDSGIGLQNVRERLELLYPGAYRLETGLSDAGDNYVVGLWIDCL